MKYTGLKIAGFVILIIIIWGIFLRNGLVSKEEKVNAQWANVENQYERRAELIPNLVNVVKGYASHESQTLIDVAEARQKATDISLTGKDVSESDLKAFGEIQNKLNVALYRLLAVAESYPELKADKNFRDLQTQIEGAENRISTERYRYNREVNTYNTAIRRFPTSIVAKVFGFEKGKYFKADAGAEMPPDVNFENKKDNLK